MTSLIFPENERELRLAPKGLQQLLHEPLSVFSQWYSNLSNNGEEDGEGGRQGEEIALGPLPGNQATPLRLHEGAESYKSSLRAGTASIVIASNEEGGINFLNLPVGVHLHIFSFLDAGSLCRLAQACNYMHNLTSDPLLWTRLLERDVRGWSVIGHLSHPKVYRDVASDLSPKHIYCQCRCHRDSLPRHSFAHPITGRLRSLVRRIQGHIPRLLMFGSGLESVPLVRSMLWEEESPYHPIGLYPGKDGVGSGVCIQHRDSPINLITLYTATRAERIAAQAGQQARVNKLVSVYSAQDKETEEGGEGEGRNGGSAELTPAIQQLCREADAFILVVDPYHLTEEALRLDLLMLQVMLHSNVSQTTPLLVLSCRPSSTEADSSQPPLSSPPVPPVEVAERLKLSELEHPWQVRSLVLKQYQPLQHGMDWLLGAANC